MSNTEMVSELLPCPFCGQQDFLIERLDSDASVVICQGLTGPHEACLARGPVGVAQDEGEEQPGRDKAVELWNARAEQHQGEPVALPARRRVRPETPAANLSHIKGWNACLDEIAKLGPLYARPMQGEPAMWANQLGDTITDKVKTHNLSLGGAPAGIAKSYTQPLYTRPAPADPGEVERLRTELSAVKFNLDKTDKGLLAADAEVRRLRKTIDGMNDAHANVVEDNAAIRAQLAERDALLIEVLPSLDLAAGAFKSAKPVRNKVKAAISASAEPSAPNIRCQWCKNLSEACRGCGAVAEEPSAPMPDYMEAACDKFDWTPEEALRFYAEGKHFDVVAGRTRILCTGAIASHALKGMGGEYAGMKGIEPSVPVERDERAEFEAYRDRRNAQLTAEGARSKFRVTNAHYATWEARADLERKP